MTETPDDRPIYDIMAIETCDWCGTDPAPVILTEGGWECFECGNDPDEEPSGEATTET
jgi:hypothetical protein